MEKNSWGIHEASETSRGPSGDPLGTPGDPPGIPRGPLGEIKIGGHSVQRKAVIDALKKLDRDKDGRVTRSQIPKKQIQIFNAIDANSDGVVTKEEVMAALD